MLFEASKYAHGTYTMPDREDAKRDKDSREYALEVAQYVYSQFSRGGTYVDHDWYDSVTTNRNYALGMQSQEKYKDTFFGKEQTGNVLENMGQDTSRKSRRNAYANLNFDIQSPMPRVMDAIIGALSKLVNRVSVDATDRYSGARREELKWGTYVDGKFRKEFNALRAMMALPQQDVGYTPRSIEELNLYEAEGGFKLGYEEVMERLLKFAFEHSYWDEHILEKVLFDLVTVGFAVVEDVYDKTTGHVKTEYRDAQYAGVQFTQESSYRNPDYGFYVKWEKLSTLRRMGFKDKELYGIAKTFSNLYGNPNIGDWNAQNKDGQQVYNRGYDAFTVPVFVVKWIDVDFKHEKEYKNRQGKVRTKDVDAKYKSKEREKLLQTRIKTVREVSWVIGSDIVYDYGKCEFQGRDGMSEPVLPLHMVKVSGRPIIPRLIPALDQYMNAWMRLQQGISMAAMNGYAINMDAVSNLSMGGKKMSPKEVLRFWRQTGTLFFKPTDVAGRPNPGMITRPIEQLPGGAGAVIAESVQVMDLAMNQIEQLTGINPVALGSQPDPGIGKAVTEYAISGTNNVLYNVLKKANDIKSDTARAMCLRLQHVIRHDKRAYDAYVDVVGESALELLKIAEGGDIKYGIRTHARPTEQDVAELKEMIMLSLKNGRDGKVGITEADAVRFFSMINSGASLKRVALLLDFANRKAKEEAEAKEMRFIQMNSQQQQQTAQVNSAAKRQEVMDKMQADIAVENARGRADVIEKAVAEGQMTWQEALTMLGNVQPEQPQQPQQEQGLIQEPERVMPTQEEVV
jgi:hypothetical protein